MKTDRLILKKIEQSDIDFLIDLFADKDVVQYISNINDREALIEKITKGEMQWQEYGFGHCIVELKDTGEKIASLGVTVVPELDNNIVIGYVLHKKFWGKGYATEICKSVIETVFSKSKIEKIYAFVLRENKASIRVLEKAGFKFEKELEHWGKMHDLYSIAKKAPG